MSHGPDSCHRSRGQPRWTGSDESPRRTRPSPWFQCSSDGSTASRMPREPASSARNAMTASSRARRAPRQWWMPWPNARWSGDCAAYVEDVRVVVASRVPARCGQVDDHLHAGRDDASPAIVTSCGGVAERRVGDRRVVAQELLDSLGDERRVGHQRIALVRVRQEGGDSVADQGRRGVVPGDDELEQRRQQLLAGDRRPRSRSARGPRPGPRSARPGGGPRGR